MNKIKASVILNSYKDKEEYLRKAIESILNQEGVEIHLIVSTVKGDNAIKVAKEMGVGKIVINKKPGIIDQINAALPELKGDWFCYASGNDVWAPEKLITEIVWCMRKNKKVCYSAFRETDPNLNPVKIRSFYPYSYEKHMTKGNFVTDVSVIAMDLVKKYFPLNPMYANHSFHDMWLRIYEGEGNVFYYNPYPVWYYRRDEKASQSMRRRRDEGAKKAHVAARLAMLEDHKPGEKKDPESDKTETKTQEKVFKEPDIVMLYLHEEAVKDELVYAVRSITKNFPGHRLVIVGEEHPAIKPDLFIPMERTGGTFSKAKDSLVKMNTIINHPDISEDFILWYDDSILLSSIDVDFFANNFALQNLRKIERKLNNNYRECLWGSVDMLDQEPDFKEKPIFNFETHLPRVFNKSVMKRIFENYKLNTESNFKVLLATLYFNGITKEPQILEASHPVKISFTSTPDKFSYGQCKDLKEIQTLCENRVFLNFNDDGLTEALYQFIEEMFPEKSPYEA